MSTKSRAVLQEEIDKLNGLVNMFKKKDLFMVSQLKFKEHLIIEEKRRYQEIGAVMTAIIHTYGNKNMCEIVIEKLEAMGSYYISNQKSDEQVLRYEIINDLDELVEGMKKETEAIPTPVHPIGQAKPKKGDVN